MSSKRLTIIVIAIVAILGGSFGLMSYFKSLKEKPEEKPPVEAKIFVKAKPVKYEKITPMVKEGGRLGSLNTVDVISEVQGKVLNGDVPLKKGQKFKKGDLLAKVFDGEAKNNLMASKSRFLNTLANALPDLKIDYPENYKAWLNFFNAIDIAEKLPEIPSVKSDKEKTFLASRSILNDYFTIKSSEIRFDKYEIRAPFSGSFTGVNIEVGSTVNTGSRIGTIIQTSRMELEVPVKTEDVQWLNIGDEVLVFTPVSDEPLKAKIVRISDFVKPETQSASVFVSIYPQSKVKLFEGMYLNAEFSGEPIENVMEMPRSAVFDDNQVYVVENGCLKKQGIRVHKINQKTLIFSGVEEGKTLVVEPLISVSEGMKVEILK